jgi:hypothetical protein
MCCKVAAAFSLMYARNPNADWYVRSSDDSYLALENFETSLRRFNPNEHVYLGNPAISRARLVPWHNNTFDEPHGTGGSAYIISRSLAEWFAEEGQKLFASLCMHDDSFFGSFMTRVKNVIVINPTGITQANRLSEHGPTIKLDRGIISSVVRCSCPLPRSYRGGIGVFGDLYPVSPFQLNQAMALHRDPTQFVLFDALKRFETQYRSEHTDVDAQLLIYRIWSDGPFFRYCMMHKGDRERTWSGTCPH